LELYIVVICAHILLSIITMPVLVSGTFYS